MRGGLFVCGTTTDANKSWMVTGLCRVLARHRVRVAPFKGQNMALNAAVTADGAEIGHAQRAQALAALAAALERSEAPIVGICAGLQMLGHVIDDPSGVEGAAGRADGLGSLPVAARFEATKIRDRPRGTVVGGVGAGAAVSGYRIHHGRVTGLCGAEPWLVADDGTVLGWQRGRVFGTNVHGLFEDDGLRGAVLGDAAARAGVGWAPSGRAFAAVREGRVDRIADALEAHLGLGRVIDLIEQGSLTGAGA